MKGEYRWELPGQRSGDRVDSKRPDIITIVFFIGLFVCTAVNIIPWCQTAAPADLISMYSAGTMMQKGENPYDDDSLKATWISICARQKCRKDELKQLPGLPNALLYPPNTLLFYSLCAKIPWRYLTATLRSILIILLFIIIWMVWRQSESRTVPDLLLITLMCLGLNGTPWLVISINTSILIYLFLVLFYWSYKKNRNILAGIFLGAMSLKITLMVPFFIFICIRKKWKIALIALVATAIPFVALWCSDAAFTRELFSSWMQATRDWDRLLHVINPGPEMWHGFPVWKGNERLDYLTTLGPMVSFYFQNILGIGSYQVVKFMTIFITGLMYAGVYFTGRRRIIPDEHLIIMLSCIELLINYHLQYDTIIPLLFLLMIRRSIPHRMLYVLIAAVSLYYIPFNGLLLRLGIPKHFYLWAFNMALPLMVMYACTGMMCRKKSKPDGDS